MNLKNCYVLIPGTLLFLFHPSQKIISNQHFIIKIRKEKPSKGLIDKNEN